MMIKKLNRGVLLIIAALVLAACGGTTGDDEQEKNQAPNEETSEQNSDMDDMEHSDSGEIPDDLEAASNPTYEVGSQARITTDHMKGMEGAEATIVGAYDTYFIWPTAVITRPMLRCFSQYFQLFQFINPPGRKS